MITQQCFNDALDLDGQLPLWPDAEGPTQTVPVPSIPPTMIGLDTSRAPARMVITTLDDRDGRIIPFVTEEIAFHSLLELRDFWQSANLAGIRIAIPTEQADPLRIRAWLEAQALPIEQYEWMAYRAHLTPTDLRDLDLDDAYVRPYVLALYACYRLNAASVARGVWAKLFEVHYLLEELRHEVHRLTASLPEPEPWPLDPPY